MSYPHNLMKHYHRPSLNTQRGVVLVMALFIVALIATMSYVMMARLERDTHRTQLILRATQAEFYAQGAIAWALDQLKNNWEQQNLQRIIDAIPITAPVKEVNGYHITSTIYDMQARFNLNNLSDPQAKDEFQRLLQAVDTTLTLQQAQGITLAIVDWIMPNKQQANDQYYLKQSPPYRSAHQYMESASELKLIKGMTPKLYLALQPYVTALPNTTLVNIQTATQPVLMTLSPTLTKEGAQAIITLRESMPMTSTQAFSQLDVVKNNGITEKKFTVVSNYFLIKTTVTIEKQQLVIYTLAQRLTQERKAMMKIVWQSKGAW